MPSWAVGLIALFFTLETAVITWAISVERRLTRNEERSASLGRQLQSLPKRKGDMQ